METITADKTVNASKAPVGARPNVFDYVDYRTFLKDSFDFKKQRNPAYSESAFIQAAGLGKNSRGYLGLIIKGKRNISTNTILGFAEALKLGPKESMYFENMVYFNQADTEDKKTFFFERMDVSAKGLKGRAFEILESQHRYMSKWHLVVLREVVNLIEFREDPAWIVKKMRGQVTKDEVIQGLEDLQKLGLITRDGSGRLTIADPVVTFTDDKHNFKSALELHKQFAAKAVGMLEAEPYERRSARLTTLACSKEDFEAIRNEMKEFQDKLLGKYATEDKKTDVVLQLGMQLFSLTV